MSHARVTVNRKVEFDGSTDEWNANPPSMFADAIKPGGRPQPWLRSVAVALADAIQMQVSVKINVTTNSLQTKGWTMKVEYK